MLITIVLKSSSSDLEAASDNESGNLEKFHSFEDSLIRSGLSLSLQELLSEYLLLEDYFMSRYKRHQCAT